MEVISLKRATLYDIMSSKEGAFKSENDIFTNISSPRKALGQHLQIVDRFMKKQQRKMKTSHKNDFIIEYEFEYLKEYTGYGSMSYIHR